MTEAQRQAFEALVKRLGMSTNMERGRYCQGSVNRMATAYLLGCNSA